MKDLTKSEFLSFLYSEKDRINSNFSRPGWSNWAIAGSFVGLIIYLFNLLIAPSVSINWEAVLMLFISSLSLTIILIMVYPMIFPKKEIYYPNRISTLWDEAPIFEFAISGFSYAAIFILLLINHNYSWILYVFGYLSIGRFLTLGVSYFKRNKLVPSGTRFNLIPNGGFWGSLHTVISLALFASIMIYSSFCIIVDISQYIIELQISVVIIGFWVLIYLFFKTNLSPNRMANYLDNIIDKVAYSNMSQQDAMEELMFMRYGGGVKQIVENDLSAYFNSLSKLNDLNTALDNIIQNIDTGKLDLQTYFDWSKYIATNFGVLKDAHSKGKRLIERINKIFNLPNNAKHSNDFNELLESAKLGQAKIGMTIDKFEIINSSLKTFRMSFYCRKTAWFCGNLQCNKRNDKMSFGYAKRKYGIIKAIKGSIYRKF